jgi:HlyD family secretion protein
MKRVIKRGIWIGAVLAGVGGIVWLLRPAPVPAETAPVVRADLTATVTAEGRTRVRELYVVSAPVDGELARMTVEPGDAVTADSVVAEIAAASSRPLDARSRAQAEAAVKAADAAVARADAAQEAAARGHEHADTELARVRSLAQSGASAQADLDHAQFTAERARREHDEASAAVREARAERERARATLGGGGEGGSGVSVHAPVGGRVLRVLHESAGPVAAGTPLLEIGDVGTIEIAAELLSTDAVGIRDGAKASIRRWGSDAPIAAHVRRIDPAGFTKISALGLEEQRVHVYLDLDEAPPRGLGHDFRVDAAIVVWEGQDVLQVPSTALFRSGDHWAVFAVRDGRARLAPVEVGAADDDATVITGGLAEGDDVIVQPADSIRDGTRVTARAWRNGSGSTPALRVGAR